MKNKLVLAGVLLGSAVLATNPALASPGAADPTVIITAAEAAWSNVSTLVVSMVSLGILIAIVRKVKRG